MKRLNCASVKLLSFAVIAVLLAPQSVNRLGAEICSANTTGNRCGPNRNPDCQVAAGTIGNCAGSTRCLVATTKRETSPLNERCVFINSTDYSCCTRTFANSCTETIDYTCETRIVGECHDPFGLYTWYRTSCVQTPIGNPTITGDYTQYVPCPPGT